MLGMIARPMAMIPGFGMNVDANYPQSNSCNNDYGRLTRTTTAVIGANLDFDFNLGANPPSIDAVAVFWHNMSPGDTIQVFGKTAADYSGIGYSSSALTAVTGTSKRDIATPSKFLLTLPSSQTFQYWLFRFIPQAGSRAVSDGHIQFSRVALMKKCIFAIGPSKAEMTAIDMNQRIQMETGEERTSEDSLLIRPIAQLDLTYAKESEMREVLGAYALGLGTSKPMFVCPDITDSNGLQDLMTFGKPEQLISLQSDTYDIWRFQARVRSFGP
jgi:hypothetical protein